MKRFKPQLISATFEGFPQQGIHANEVFTPSIPPKKIEERLIHALRDANNETFTFEDIGNPTIPGCTVILEFGIADSHGFTFIDEEELRKILMALKQRTFDVMDFFCAIRYYKDYTTFKKPQKFDYYLARFMLSESVVELQVFHERGPRYLSPADMVIFLTNRINGTSGKKSRKILKRIQTTDRLN